MVFGELANLITAKYPTPQSVYPFYRPHQMNWKLKLHLSEGVVQWFRISWCLDALVYIHTHFNIRAILVRGNPVTLHGDVVDPQLNLMVCRDGLKIGQVIRSQELDWTIPPPILSGAGQLFRRHASLTLWLNDVLLLVRKSPQIFFWTLLVFPYSMESVKWEKTLQ